MLSAMTIHGSTDYQQDPTSLLILLDFDASMVCPCASEVTHRARNMEAVPRKEHDSTCRQSVWDATTEDIHHDNLVPNTWWAAENTQPCVRMHHTCHQSKAPFEHQPKSLSRKRTQKDATSMLSAMTIHGSTDYQQNPTSLLILLDFDASMVCPCGSEVTHRARNMEAVPRKEHDSTCRQSVWDATTEDIHHDNLVPNTWWAAENTQPCVRMHHTCHQSKAPFEHQPKSLSRKRTQKDAKGRNVNAVCNDNTWIH